MRKKRCHSPPLCGRKKVLLTCMKEEDTPSCYRKAFQRGKTFPHALWMRKTFPHALWRRKTFPMLCEGGRHSPCFLEEEDIPPFFVEEEDILLCFVEEEKFHHALWSPYLVKKKKKFPNAL
jgi:hypothetical protein